MPSGTIARCQSDVFCVSYWRVSARSGAVWPFRQNLYVVEKVVDLVLLNAGIARNLRRAPASRPFLRSPMNAEAGHGITSPAACARTLQQLQTVEPVDKRAINRLLTNFPDARRLRIADNPGRGANLAVGLGDGCIRQPFAGASLARAAQPQSASAPGCRCVSIRRWRSA